MYKLIMSVLISQLVFTNCSNSQHSFPDRLTGDWISIQFKQALADSLEDKIILNLSPQLLSFDSIGKCSVQASHQSIFSLGEPTKIQFSGRDNQDLTVTYVSNKKTYIVWTISNNSNYLFLEIPGTLTRILFTRYKGNR